MLALEATPFGLLPSAGKRVGRQVESQSDSCCGPGQVHVWSGRQTLMESCGSHAAADAAAGRVSVIQVKWGVTPLHDLSRTPADSQQPLPCRRACRS